MKKYFKTLLVSVVAFVTSATFASFSVTSSHAAEAKTYKSINPIMVQIGKVMTDIYPLIVAQKKFSPAEKKHIAQALDKLSELFNAAQPFIAKKSDGYQISYEFVVDYLKVVKGVLAKYHIDYARSHLYALSEICASCHTQDTTLRTLFGGATRKGFASDIAYADYNFVTRNYPPAIKYYEKSLATPGAKTELEVIQPMQRILTVYVQVNNDLAAAKAFLQKHLSLPDHSPETKKQVQDWLAGLDKLIKNKADKKKPMSFATLQKQVKTYLGSLDSISFEKTAAAQDEIIRVWLRGQLYHYLNSNPQQDEIPKLLYWLSVTDRSIAYNFYFSLADLYLKQCVLKYTQHPYAKRCFGEYQSYVNHTYDWNVPPGIREEMKKLEQALKPR